MSLRGNLKRKMHFRLQRFFWALPQKQGPKSPKFSLSATRAAQGTVVCMWGQRGPRFGGNELTTSDHLARRFLVTSASQHLYHYWLLTSHSPQITCSGYLGSKLRVCKEDIFLMHYPILSSSLPSILFSIKMTLSRMLGKGSQPLCL